MIMCCNVFTVWPQRTGLLPVWPRDAKVWLHLLEDVLVKVLQHGISKILLPMFSSWTFMMSRLMFKSFLAF